MNDLIESILEADTVVKDKSRTDSLNIQKAEIVEKIFFSGETDL